VLATSLLLVLLQNFKTPELNPPHQKASAAGSYQ